MDVRRIGVDSKVFELFYRSHVRVVERFVARRVADPHTVADLTAETFLASVESAHRFDPAKGEPRAWLLGIAYRVVAGEQRRAARAWHAHTRDAGQRCLSEDSIAALDERLDAEQAARAVREALAGVPDGDRALLELRWVDGMTVAEIATALRLKQGTVRVRLHRARHRLQKVLVRTLPPVVDMTVASVSAAHKHSQPKGMINVESA